MSVRSPEMGPSFPIQDHRPSHVPLVELCIPNERYERRKLQNRRSQRTLRSRRVRSNSNQPNKKGDVMCTSNHPELLITERQVNNVPQANLGREPPLHNDRSNNSSSTSSTPGGDAGPMPFLLNELDLENLSRAQRTNSESEFALNAGERSGYFDSVPPWDITAPVQSGPRTSVSHDKAIVDIIKWPFNTLPKPELLQHRPWTSPDLPTSMHEDQITQLPGQFGMESVPYYALTPPQSLPSQNALLPSPDSQKRETKAELQAWYLPLHIAVEQGHELIIRELLQAAVDINESDSSGRTALHIAVHQKQEGILRILLEHGPDVNAVDAMGWAPVHHAIQNGFTSGLKLLLEHGGNLGLRAPKGSP